MLKHGFPNLLVSIDHRVFQARIDQIDLCAAACQKITVARTHRFPGHFFHFAQDARESVVLETIFQTAKTVVRKVFKPFKIRDRNTTCVDEKVRQDNNAFGDKDRVGIRCNGAVGGLSDNFCFDA